MSFYAVSTTTINNIGTKKKIGYQSILTNVGGAYKDDGTFKAPSDGVYVFNWTILCAKSATDSWVNVYLMKNDAKQGVTVQTHCKEQNAQSSSTAVLVLQANDKVHLAADASTKGHIYGHAHSSFSGWKL